MASAEYRRFSRSRDPGAQLVQPRRRPGCRTGRAPVRARRQRAAGPDLGRVGQRRALELAGLEEAVDRNTSQPVADLARASTRCGARRGSGRATRRARGRPRRAGRERRPCSAGSRSAARSRGRSPGARRGRRCSSVSCSGPSPSSSSLAGISSGEIAVSRIESSTALASAPNWSVSIAQRMQELDQRLGDRGVDVVVRHLVADAVGRPAERQLGEVAGAEHERAVVVGQPEQVRGPLAGLDVLVGDVVLGLPPSAAGWPRSRSICVADGRMSISAALTPERLHQRVGVAQRARAGGEARQRVARARSCAAARAGPSRARRRSARASSRGRRRRRSRPSRCPVACSRVCSPRTWML